MKVLTANRLIDGEAVWYAAHGWRETLEGAEIVTDRDGEARIEAIGRSIAGSPARSPRTSSGRSG